MKAPKNENYAAQIVEIKTLRPLENCDKVQAAVIMGNQVIVSKDVTVGMIGIYFPVECQLSAPYLEFNNLYRKPELNSDKVSKGYFEENGRIKSIKFRSLHKSEGLFMPITSLGFIKTKESLSIGTIFDELDGILICKKYRIKTRVTNPSVSKSKKLAKKHENKLIEDQFRLHYDTSMLYRNLHHINPDSLLHISTKAHGTSFITSKLLCKKPLKTYEKILKKLGVNIVDKQYDFLYSSRNVIKNADLHEGAQHFYSEDIWGVAHERIKDYLQNGMTMYAEIVGYTSNSAYIQEDFDYGCEPGTFEIYIYRITYTNDKGNVFEFTPSQVQTYCKQVGLNPVPEVFFGKATELVPYNEYDRNIDKWRDDLLEEIRFRWNEHDCSMCKNVVPEEGVVIKVNGMEGAFKCKSTRFYEYETTQLDKGVIDIESEESDSLIEN